MIFSYKIPAISSEKMVQLTVDNVSLATE